MVYITKIEVSEEVTNLMKGVGFYQQTASSPNIKWNNLQGIEIVHHYQECPRSIDDVLRMVYTEGYNLGRYEQSETYDKHLKGVVSDFINKYRLTTKIVRRADNNFLLQDLKCVE